MSNERQIRFQIRDLNDQLFTAPDYLRPALQQQLISLWTTLRKLQHAAATALKPVFAK